MLLASKYSKIIKQYRVYIIIMIASIIYCIVLFLINFMNMEKFQKVLNTNQQSIMAAQRGISTLDQNVQTLNAQLEFQNILSNVSSNQYDANGMKKFMAAYDTLLFANSSVNQVVYSFDDKSNTLTATISIDGSYSDVRSLIYYIETHFYFINVKDVSLYSSEGSVRGSVVMDIYFRDGNS